mgnify:CR=1 FL=1
MSHSSSALAERPWCVALVGNPNCGKTALFNLLTGARQKVANYAGVTVERKVGSATLRDGRTISVVDLPGAYSLSPATPDEQITLEVIEGRRAGEDAPDAIVAVVDATNLRMNLRLVLELQRLGRPMMVALNMADVARAQGLVIDTERLSRELGCPVAETVAVRHDGHAQLLQQIQAWGGHAAPPPGEAAAARGPAELQREVRRILGVAMPGAPAARRFHTRIDALVMHPVWGLALLALLLFLIFQAVFSWAAAPMDAIEGGMAALGQWLGAHMAEGPLRSLLVDGIIAGVGGVLVFLPQIVILFFFILVLEDVGYMARAAFLMDRIMGGAGLHGRAFIPLLSSFACAIPGVMATRVIDDRRDRLTTILVAPLMTCSARIPVYTLIIGAFIPDRDVWGIVGLQGLVMFGLYAAGIAGALAVSFVLKRLIWRGAPGEPFMLEMPDYKIPQAKSLAIGLWTRATIFLKRAGTTILSMMVLIWLLASFPQPPEGATEPAISYSLAAMIGSLIQPLTAPLGFNWQINVALIPGMAAREVAVGALGTIYAIGGGESAADKIGQAIAGQWSLATALALLAWYVFAPQCASTLAVIRRETGGWKWMWVTFFYMLGLAYAAALLTNQIARALGAG